MPCVFCLALTSVAVKNWLPHLPTSPLVHYDTQKQLHRARLSARWLQLFFVHGSQEKRGFPVHPYLRSVVVCGIE